MLFWRKKRTIDVVCPHCGAHQTESEECISTVCRSCRQYFQLDQAHKLHRKKKSGRRAPRQITCFGCSVVLEVASDAVSTICPNCSHHIDLNDYTITGPYGRSLETKGVLFLGEKGSISAESIHVAQADLRGRVRVGRFVCDGDVELHPTAVVIGSMKVRRLILMARAALDAPGEIEADEVIVHGNLHGRIVSHGRLVIARTGSVEGEVVARSLDVEPGGRLVGGITIKSPPPPEPPAPEPADAPLPGALPQAAN